ncbi:epoxide hydrolase 2-like isoform X2 [Dermacentor variabilis]|uniref:epoxide hydrolase 2-like isoform X2 n=1 Tax=Dermacentor variabilis TaxID=34621 RepID=UPI003F5BA9A9
MVPAPIGKLMVLAIGTSMWLWLKAVVAPDLRGYGNTTRPEDTAQYLMRNLIEDVKGLLERLNSNHTRKVVLIGHDWGGMISFCFATLHEKLIDGMVIINGMHPMAFAKQLFTSMRQIRMSWYQLPFRHPVIPERYLIMHDLKFFDKVHRGFTANETEAHKYMFSQNGALTGAISYYRAFNNDSKQLQKLPYKKINVSTLILWAEEDAFIMTPIAKYNQEWLKKSNVVYYKGAGHWLPRECSTQVTEQIRKFAMNITTNRTATKQVKLKSVSGMCKEASFPTKRRWFSKLFPWLPRNANLPKKMRE